MDTVKIEIEVPKEVHELGQGIIAILKAAKEAGKDGWQLGQDLPALATAAFAQMAAFEGMDKIGDEFKADPAGAGKALAHVLADAYALYKKDESAE